MSRIIINILWVNFNKNFGKGISRNNKKSTVFLGRGLSDSWSSIIFFCETSTTTIRLSGPFFFWATRFCSYFSGYLVARRAAD